MNEKVSAKMAVFHLKLVQDATKLLYYTSQYGTYFQGTKFQGQVENIPHYLHKTSFMSIIMRTELFVDRTCDPHNLKNFMP